MTIEIVGLFQGSTHRRAVRAQTGCGCFLKPRRAAPSVLSINVFSEFPAVPGRSATGLPPLPPLWWGLDQGETGMHRHPAGSAGGLCDKRGGGLERGRDLRHKMPNLVNLGPFRAKAASSYP